MGRYSHLNYLIYNVNRKKGRLRFDPQFSNRLIRNQFESFEYFLNKSSIVYSNLAIEFFTFYAPRRGVRRLGRVRGQR